MHKILNRIKYTFPQNISIIITSEQLNKNYLIQMQISI
jgi:hypothetical protein